MRRLAALFALLVLALPACRASDSKSPDALGTAAGGDGSFAQAEGQRSSGGYAGAGQAKRAPAPSEGAAYEPQTARPAMDMAEDEAAYAERDYDRDQGPGLGTSYGEQRSSSTTTAPFTRAHSRRPDEVLSIWYDDTAGIQNMVDWKGGYYDGTAWTQSSDGLLSVSILDEYGSGLTGMQVGDKRYAAGRGSGSATPSASKTTTADATRWSLPWTGSTSSTASPPATPSVATSSSPTAA